MTQPPRVARPVRDRFYARTFALVTCLVLGLALFKIVQPFLGPLLWATLHRVSAVSAACAAGRAAAWQTAMVGGAADACSRSSSSSAR